VARRAAQSQAKSGIFEAVLAKVDVNEHRSIHDGLPL
jgi:hypothetical protein